MELEKSGLAKWYIIARDTDRIQITNLIGKTPQSLTLWWSEKFWNLCSLLYSNRAEQTRSRLHPKPVPKGFTYNIQTQSNFKTGIRKRVEFMFIAKL